MKIELSEAVFQSYAFFSAILVVKMLLMSLLTAKNRFAKKVSILCLLAWNNFVHNLINGVYINMYVYEMNLKKYVMITLPIMFNFLGVR